MLAGLGAEPRPSLRELPSSLCAVHDGAVSGLLENVASEQWLIESGLLTM